jgi:hypothetical protein
LRMGGRCCSTTVDVGRRRASGSLLGPFRGLFGVGRDAANCQDSARLLKIKHTLLKCEPVRPPFCDFDFGSESWDQAASWGRALAVSVSLARWVLALTVGGRLSCYSNQTPLAAAALLFLLRNGDPIRCNNGQDPVIVDESFVAAPSYCRLQFPSIIKQRDNVSFRFAASAA